MRFLILALNETKGVLTKHLFGSLGIGMGLFVSLLKSNLDILKDQKLCIKAVASYLDYFSRQFKLEFILN